MLVHKMVTASAIEMITELVDVNDVIIWVMFW